MLLKLGAVVDYPASRPAKWRGRVTSQWDFSPDFVWIEVVEVFAEDDRDTKPGSEIFVEASALRLIPPLEQLAEEG